MKNFILLFTLLTISLISCKKDANPESENFSITYSENSGWFSYSYTAKIDQSRNLIIIHQNKNLNSKSVYQITENEINTLKDKMSNLSKIELADNYGFDFVNSPKDLPFKTISYQSENKAASTSLYFPSMNELPSELNYLLTEFQKVLTKYDTLRK